VKKLLGHMWLFMLLAFVVSMGLSTLFYFAYMRSRLY
jgi:hypothetical protein